MINIYINNMGKSAMEWIKREIMESKEKKCIFNSTLKVFVV
jgi:hypothetical protein